MHVNCLTIQLGMKSKMKPIKMGLCLTKRLMDTLKHKINRYRS